VDFSGRGLTLRALIVLTTVMEVGAPGHGVEAQEPAVAIVGASIIDGNGGPALHDGTLVVRGKRIVALGPRAAIAVPAGARVIDGSGKYLTPGFIDTNVHVSMMSGTLSYARYWDRHDQVVLQAAQMHLRHGITTIRDSYGALIPLMKIRDAIARAEVVGPRILVAGNIVGWGGSYSETFRGTPESDLSYFEEQINDFITQGSGEEWMHMNLDELRRAVNRYLDLGVDFIKYGGTSHHAYPALLGFSPAAQKVIVEETHKRGLVAETHASTLEGLRLSILAGIDLVQHPRSLGDREITDELLRLLVERKVICSGLQNTITGEVWQRHVATQTGALRDQWVKGLEYGRRAGQTGAEVRRADGEAGIAVELKRRNAEKLVTAGCITSVGTDNLVGEAPEFRREKKPEHQEPGFGTVLAIEGLVELGMTPAQAITAATKHGAMACRQLDQFGTLEVGKLADILLLRADPLADIRNIRQLEWVMRDGRIIDPDSLPTHPVWGEW
jgi:imidazolonepropionase-like amidohydrolase